MLRLKQNYKEASLTWTRPLPFSGWTVCSSTSRTASCWSWTGPAWNFWTAPSSGPCLLARCSWHNFHRRNKTGQKWNFYLNRSYFYSSLTAKKSVDEFNLFFLLVWLKPSLTDEEWRQLKPTVLGQLSITLKLPKASSPCTRSSSPIFSVQEKQKHNSYFRSVTFMPSSTNNGALD